MTILALLMLLGCGGGKQGGDTGKKAPKPVGPTIVLEEFIEKENTTAKWAVGTATELLEFAEDAMRDDSIDEAVGVTYHYPAGTDQVTSDLLGILFYELKTALYAMTIDEDELRQTLGETWHESQMIRASRVVYYMINKSLVKFKPHQQDIDEVNELIKQVSISDTAAEEIKLNINTKHEK